MSGETLIHLWAFVLFRAREKVIQKNNVIGMERTEVGFMGSEDADSEKGAKKEDFEFSSLDDQMESSAINMDDTDSLSPLNDRERGHSYRQSSGMGQR